MKKFLCSILFLFVVLNSFAESLQNKDIHLKFHKSHSKSIPVTAFIESGHGITFCFNQKFDQMRICLMNNTGVVVYDNTIDAVEDFTFSIPLTGIVNGNYVILLTNAEYEISGSFILEKDN